MDVAAALRKEATRSRRLAGAATNYREKADLSVFAYELDARAVVVEEAFKEVGIDKTTPTRTAL